MNLQLLHYIQEQKRKKITFQKMRYFIVNYFEDYYLEHSDKGLVKNILELEEQNILKPVKTSGKNWLKIHTKYHITTPSKEVDDQLIEQLRTMYHPKINLKYYIQNLEEWEMVKRIGVTINDLSCYTTYEPFGQEPAQDVTVIFVP
jgi:hypothetical protein